MSKFPYRYRILVFLFFLILITYLDRISISLVGVRIKTAFDLNNEQFGWVLAAFSLAYALFEIPAGALGDRIGQRAVLLRIVLWWSLFTALTGLTTGLVSLLFVRFLFGMGEAGAFPASSGVISRWLPKSETARGLTAVFLGLSVGSAIAPLIVVPIATAYGWRSTFFFNGFIGLLWVLVCFLWFRDNPSEIKAVSAEEQKFIEDNRRFNKQERTIKWWQVIKNKNLLTLSLAFFCSQWGNYFFIGWMPVYLQEGKHFTEDEMKMTTFFAFAVGIAMNFATGYLSDLLSRKKGLGIGRRVFGMFALGMSGLTLLLAATTEEHAVIATCMILGHFFFAANGSTSFTTCVDIGGNNAGTVAGVMNFFGQTGALLLVLSFGKIADATHSFNVPVYVLSAVLLTGCALWGFVNAGKPIIPESQCN